MARPIMKCGHAANATDSNGNPVCVICLGIVPGATQIDENSPSLEARKSQCTYCDSVVPSSSDLPFFEHRPEHQYDKHYDGCRGWE